ncbi:MAG: hypothetical protein K0S65_6333 [Labilithrix sp.]|nr:hypothetical protein [Labilithrix sp.]
MTDRIRVRAYNVLFGDALLVSIPDDGTTRHILIDVGNKVGAAGGNAVFEPVIENIAKVVGDAGVDLYVMTHEHMDHVEGLPYYVKHHGELPFAIHRAWLTGSAAPNYLETHPDAEREVKKKKRAYARLKRLALARGYTNDARIKALLENNDPDETDKCVNVLRELAPKRTHYVYRGKNVSKLHPFVDAKLSLWAPEEDTSVYYGRKIAEIADGADLAAQEKAPQAKPLPLAGVDASAFYNLVARRDMALMEGLLSIDKAENNTSVVLCIEWRGRKLLFVGDAEQKSWRTMSDLDVLKPVDFLKIGHHGSKNATPPEEILEKILPNKTVSGRKAVVSTCLGGYHGVPDSTTLKRLSSRAKVASTLDVAPGKWIDVTLTAT